MLGPKLFGPLFNAVIEPRNLTEALAAGAAGDGVAASSDPVLVRESAWDTGIAVSKAGTP